MHIFFATPCGRAVVQNSFMTSVITTMKTIQQFGVDSSYGYVTSADIVYNRNILANQFFTNPEYTHICFVDDDMVFEPKVILKLIRADVDVVGVAATRRELNMDQFVDVCHEEALKGNKLTPMEIMSRIATFNVRPFSSTAGTPTIIVDDDLLRVEAVGTGIMLIKREVMEKLAASPNMLRHNKINEHEALFIKDGRLIGFFDKIWDTESQTYWHEDFSFCYRWRTECDGKVHAFIDDAIGHIGDFVYTGNYLTSLLARCPPSVHEGHAAEEAIAQLKKSPIMGARGQEASAQPVAANNSKSANLMKPKVAKLR